MSERPPLDKDYVLTAEGLCFCVVSYLHPPDAYTAYLQYLPAPPGADPRRQRIKPMDFPHVGAVAETTAWLRQHHPLYVRRCPVRDVELPLVPRERVARYFCPEERLRQVLAQPRDRVEEEVAAFVQALAAASGLPPAAFGITGSVLLDLHDPDTSDMDLVVYGTEAAVRVREAVLSGAMAHLEPVPPEHRERWLRLMSTHHPLTREEAAYFVARRWHYGYYRGREFSIKCVHTPAELTEAYGQRSYRGVGLATVRGRVADAGGAPFLPAVYRLAEAVVTEGPPVPLTEVVAYEALYQWAFDPGQAVEARGKLEAVSDGSYRLVVGSTVYHGQEYMRPLL